jgi:hypothetical protein
VTSARRAALIGGVGLLTGALTQLGQSVLPDGWSQAANAISPWLAVAFGLGAVMPDRRWAVAAGIAALLAALVGYYAMTTLRFGIGGSTSALIFWGTGALVGGLVFGPAGHIWRRGARWERAVAIGLLAAAAIAEGGYQAGIRPDPSVGIGFIVVGAAVPLIIGRTVGDRLRGYAATMPTLALGWLGFQAAIRLSEVLAGVG